MWILIQLVWNGQASRPLPTAITTAGLWWQFSLSLQYSSCHCQFIDVSPFLIIDLAHISVHDLTNSVQSKSWSETFVYCHTDAGCGHVAGFVQWHVGKGLTSACTWEPTHLVLPPPCKNHGLSWGRSHRREGRLIPQPQPITRQESTAVLDHLAPTCM